MANLFRILYFLSAGLRRLYWNRRRLRKYQEKRLRAVVRYAYEFVPFYHNKFRRFSLVPEDIKTLDDLPKLPVVRKDDLQRLNPSMLVSRQYDAGKLKVLRTSGSTGKPFKFYISSVEDDWRKAIYLRANISCGQRPRDKWVFVTSPRHFADTTNIQRRLGIFAQNCISVFDRTANQVKLIRKAKPDVLDGYSGALYLIGRYVEREGISDIRPRLMFGSADFIDVSACRYLEKVFQAPYYDQFGCSEVDRTAWQCPEQTGYHMDVDSVITEFVDEEGNAVSAGERGEIVHTSLFNFAMPFIRYSVGDVGKPSADECPCGRVLPLMEVIEGRKDSFVVLPDGKVMSPRAFTVAMSMFEYYDCIEQFRIVQKRVGFFDVLLKLKKVDLTKGDIAEKLKLHFQRILGISAEGVTFNVSFVDEIPLTKNGRLSAVVSEVSSKV